MNKRQFLARASALYNKAPSGIESDFRAGFRETNNGPELIVHGEIGDPWEELDSRSFKSRLADLAGEDVTLDINSGGGFAWEGLAMATACAEHGNVTAKVTGLAFSAASVLTAGCKRVQIYPTAAWGLHRSWSLVGGNVDDIRDMADWLETLDKLLVESYAAKTGMDRDKITDYLIGENRDGTLFTGAEAVEAGFVDELLELHGKDDDEEKEVAARKAAARKRIRDARTKMEASLKMQARREQLRQWALKGKG